MTNKDDFIISLAPGSCSNGLSPADRAPGSEPFYAAVGMLKDPLRIAVLSLYLNALDLAPLGLSFEVGGAMIPPL